MVSWFLSSGLDRPIILVEKRFPVRVPPRVSEPENFFDLDEISAAMIPLRAFFLRVPAERSSAGWVPADKGMVGVSGAAARRQPRRRDTLAPTMPAKAGFSLA